MIIKPTIISDLRITKLEDLYKVKNFMEVSKIKVNESQIARELGVDRRTVHKYINGFKKSKTRSRSNCLKPYIPIIRELLSDESVQIFYYRRVLWSYLSDNHGYVGSYSNFCYYLNLIPEFASYFRRRGPKAPDVVVRYETPVGKQAQIDWKESMKLLTTDMGWVEVNIFVLLLSCSRYRVYQMTRDRTQDELFFCLDHAFQILGGVPSEIVTDNMKTVMSKARTRNTSGEVNAKFKQFADDYGFTVQPCVASTPRTKGKVESPMRILDELYAYNGKLTYMGFVELLAHLNDRENTKVHPGTGKIPLMYLQKEKSSLGPLPADTIRSPYQIIDHRVTVDKSALFLYEGIQYSVPPKYIGEKVTLQVYDDYIYVYFNMNLITLHRIGSRKINYHPNHYVELLRKAKVFSEADIEQRAKENLKALGEVYGK